MPQMIFQVCDLFLSHETEFGGDSESSSTFGHGTTAVTVHPPTQPRSASAECAEAASPACSPQRRAHMDQLAEGASIHTQIE